MGKPFNHEKHRLLRQQMVDHQLRRRDINDPQVLEAMATVPRHCFVPPALRAHAYEDRPLPIGHNQTISQPYIVALTTQLARPRPEHRALDVGCGSGYQAAVLAQLVAQVDAVELIPELAEAAAERLDHLGYHNVVVHCGDGHAGWAPSAPYDLIVVAAATGEVPPLLLEQLCPGGRLVLPLGWREQELVVVEKRRDGSVRRFKACDVRFVPLVRPN